MSNVVAYCDSQRWRASPGSYTRPRQSSYSHPEQPIHAVAAGVPSRGADSRTLGRGPAELDVERDEEDDTVCCGCLVLLIGGVFPRLAIFLLWIFSDVLSQAFDSFWVGFLGFLLLPYTTLAFALVDYWQDGINGLGWLLVILGFVIDIGSYTGGYARRGDVPGMSPG